MSVKDVNLRAPGELEWSLAGDHIINSYCSRDKDNNLVLCYVITASLVVYCVCNFLTPVWWLWYNIQVMDSQVHFAN